MFTVQVLECDGYLLSSLSGVPEGVPQGGSKHMGRKRTTQTSPIYGSFLVSILYRSMELMDTSGQISQQATTLNNTLSSMFKIPEVKAFAAIALEKITSTPDAEYKRGFRQFVDSCLPSFSSAYEAKGMPDPMKKLPQNK